MENTVSDNTTSLLAPSVIVGEAVAGESAQALKQVTQLVKGISTNTFDLAEALHKVKKNKFYQPKYETFGEYAKTLELKLTKAYYLVRMIENMEAAGVSREKYEPVGIAKLRLISRLDMQDENGAPKMYQGVSAENWIKGMIAHAPETTPSDLEAMIKGLLGLTGDNSTVWENWAMTLGQRTKWHEAIELAKKNIGTVGVDADGKHKDASTGRCCEIVAISYLQDPNNYPEEAKNDV
jgi:hypothetical protein